MNEMKAMVVENHPNDSRVKIREDGICQSLTGRMGTGGNNVPLVLTYRKVRRVQSEADKVLVIKDDKDIDREKILPLGGR